MVKFIALIILITTIGAELGALWLAYHSFFFMALLGHAVLSLVAVFVVLQLLPARFANNKSLLAFLCLFCIIFTLPAFGMISMSLCLLAGLHLQRLVNSRSFQILHEPSLGSSSDIITSNTIYYDLGLRGMLSTRNIYIKRSATTAAKKVGLKRAINLLKAALKDKDDEVRLSAYAIIDGKNKDIETWIQKLKSFINSADTSENSSSTLARVHEILAELYYEQFDLGLADGLMQKYILDQAEKSVESSTMIETNYRRSLLKARIFLSQSKLPEAGSILNRLEEQNQYCSQLNWELIKYNFNCRDIPSLKHKLRLLEKNTAPGGTYKRVLRLWND